MRLLARSTAPSMVADGTRTYQSRQFEGTDDHDQDGPQDDKRRIKGRFREFIRNYREEKNQIFPYRVQLMERYRRDENFIKVDLEDLGNYDEKLLDVLREKPKAFLPVFESAAKQALIQTIPNYNPEVDGPLADIQVILRSNEVPRPLRALAASDVNKLMVVPGIITAAHRSFSKITMQKMSCTKCDRSIEIDVRPCADPEGPPAKCPNPECEQLNSYRLKPDYSTYVDSQSLKLQELPDAVPTGDMPRSIRLSAERSLVDRVSPGARVKVTGIWTVKNQRERKDNGPRVSNVKASHFLVIGLEEMEGETGRSSQVFTPEDEERFLELSRDPNIYQKIASSIAPAISGDYTHDIKKAILCLLFGGTRRCMPDGLTLRGDINVLLLGDPSTAKSQFLKFVEKVAPIAVYTSGKGSSAAGLTANVIKDSRGEFYLEGGAMVLADGGVVCIDEFDKMREQDKVAIHEAMEQQTISVAKAGITTILNTRTSVLAAANPHWGTYNDMYSAAENINFMPTILSRFDLIFIVRDIRDPEKDRRIARHVIGVHVNASSQADEIAQQEDRGDENELGLLTLKKYIKYCRLKCAPVLSPQGAELLSNHYVSVREEHRKRTGGFDAGSNSASKDKDNKAIPLTVRQLQAVVRISEAIAKVELSTRVTGEHVTEAIRLFKVSTLTAANNTALPGDISGLDKEKIKAIQEVEEQILGRISCEQTIERMKLVNEFVNYQKYPPQIVQKAIEVLVSRGTFKAVAQQKFLKRVKAS